MTKFLNACRGFFLTLAHVKTFPLEVFKDKRVAIVGPASSVNNTGRGTYIDNFDIVIRVNKSAILVDSGKSASDIGKRTDILFHCFLENDYSGGGKLDFEMFERQGIRYVINPRVEFTGLRNSFNFYKKYLTDRTTYILPRKIFNSVSASVHPHRPTTGFSALCALVHSEFSELYITGFTFFKTAYAEGYRDDMKQSDQARAFIKEVGLHNPDAEFRAFKKLLEAHRSRNILLDETLENILAVHS